MLPMTIDALCDVIDGSIEGNIVAIDKLNKHGVQNIGIDSRSKGHKGIFFAIKGERRDGHQFIAEAFKNGYAACVVGKNFPHQSMVSEIIIRVNDTLEALLALASFWRKQSHGQWIGISGSHGKTTIKDMLVSALSHHGNVSASPGSFNSHLGVALSILSIRPDIDYAIIEAGISGPGQMEDIRETIRPNFGIFTGVGEIYRSRFLSRHEHLRHLANLFQNISQKDGWILCSDEVSDEEIKCIGAICPAPLYRLGDEDEDRVWPEVRIQYDQSRLRGYLIEFTEPTSRISHSISVRTDSIKCARLASLVYSAAFRLNPSVFSNNVIDEYIAVPTRMKTWHAPTGITLLYDVCGFDRLSVSHACDTLKNLKRPNGRAVFITTNNALSDDMRKNEDDRSKRGRALFENGVAPLSVADALNLCDQNEIDKFIVVGEPDELACGYSSVGDGKFAKKNLQCVSLKKKLLRLSTIKDAADFIRTWAREDDTILFRGKNNCDLYGTAGLLLDTPASNRLTVDLRAIAENVRRFKRHCGENIKVLAMLKALAYGTQLIELGRQLARLEVDWIGVSTPDEGAQLRRNGVDIPILTMLCPPNEVEKAIRYNLTVALYSFDLVEALSMVAKKIGGREILEVHLKVDSGMGRLGVRMAEVVALADYATKCGLKVTGAFTHYSQADDPMADKFTLKQRRSFDKALDSLKHAGYADLIAHASASSAASRFPNHCYDMIRIGIGLYGYASSHESYLACPLMPALTLTSQLVAVTSRKRGDRIGYGGTFIVPCNGFKMGIIPMGYHDGLPLSIAGKFPATQIREQVAPIIGRLSMDSAAIDLTNVNNATVGDEVLLWGGRDCAYISPDYWASCASTISHELLARIGPRVQRVFIGD